MVRHWLYKNARWLYNLVNPIWIYVRNWRDKTHYYPTGVKRGVWCDHVQRLQYAMEWAFLDFLEGEYARDMTYDWDAGEYMDFDSDFDRVIYALQMEVTDVDSEHQVDAAKKAMETYLYLKVYRPKIDRITRGYSEMFWDSIQSDPSVPIWRRMATGNKTFRDRSGEWAVKRNELDQKALHNIVDLRPRMWT